MSTVSNAVLAEPETRQRLEAAGLEVLGGTPETLAAHLAAETAAHAELVRRAGIRID